jgi:1-acyl-sn-glycerol-3-phosphate acyltransferase
MILLRSLLAFIIPSVVGIALLLVCLPLGRRRALTIALPVITTFGTRIAGISLDVQDNHHLLAIRPAVFVINHQSATDPLIVAALLKKDVVGVAKIQLKRHPLLGPLLALAGTVFIDRAAHAGVQSLAPALLALKKGYAIALAPEGTRSHDRRLGTFRDGAIWLAQQANVPIIPIILHNSADALPAGKLLIRPATIRVTVLAAENADLIDGETLRARYANCL